MTVSDEQLIAYADGVLSGEEARTVEAALNARPELRAFVETQQRLRQHMHAAFAPVLGEPMPERLMAALARAPVSWRWRLSRAFARMGQRVTDRRFLIGSGLPTAAALACGIAIGIAIVPSGVIDVQRGQGTIAARGALAAALEQQLASAQDMTVPTRVGVSFRAKDGRYCRTFESAGRSASLSGVACRDAQGWSVVALATTPSETNAGSYRMAGSAMPPIIRRTIGSMMSGEPLDAAGERQARDGGWRVR